MMFISGIVLILAFSGLIEGNEQLILTSMESKRNETHILGTSNTPSTYSSKSQPEAQSSDSSKLEHYNSTQEAEELLPSVQALVWTRSDLQPAYALPPYESSRKKRPIVTSRNPDDFWNEKQRLSSPHTNEDYFYRNKKGEWIYVVPEDDFDHVLDLGYSFVGVKGNYGNMRHYLNKQEPHSAFSHEYPVLRKPRYRSSSSRPDHSSYNSWTEEVPFLTKLFNTGNGFLSMLNPLTYLTTEKPPPPDINPQAKMNRRRNRKRPVLSDPPPYNRPTSSLRESLMSDFTHDYSNSDNNPPKHFQENDYEYQDYVYRDNNYDYTATPSSNEYFKYGNYFDERRPIEEDSSSTPDPRPTPPPDYYPRRTKKKTVATEQTNTNSDYDNIYKFLDLEMLYDSQTIENIKKIQDEHTLDYLKQNKLREDLYIGKDGNIYIKEKIILHQDDDGFQPYHINRFPQSQSPIERKMDDRVKRKRLPPYTTIKRNRKADVDLSKPSFY